MPTRDEEINGLEGQLNRLGVFIVLTVDREDVRERVVRELPDHILDAIAADVAEDLASRETLIGLNEAIYKAAEDWK